MELKEVCESLLDNADMSIDFSRYPNVKLELYVQGTVGGKYWKVFFECGQVVCMDAEFDDDSSENDLFTVLEANITETVKKKVIPAVRDRMDSLSDDDLVWKLCLYGEMSLTIVTTKFEWQLIELSKQDYESFYA